MPPRATLALLLLGCQIDRDRLIRPSSAPAPTLEASPPPAAGPEGAALAQLLFAGEQGAPAAVLGQRARMLFWLDAMALNPAQSEGLLALAAALQAQQATLQAALDQLAAAEAAALDPVYRSLILALAAKEDPAPEFEADLASQLELARASAPASAALSLRHQALKGMLAQTGTWIGTLDEDQQQRLGECRFFLRHRVGPLVAPGDHATLIGNVWDGVDFDSILHSEAAHTEVAPMDLGGLWAGESVRATPDHRLSALQRQALLFLAALSPGLPEALEVRLGRRAPLDLGTATP